MRTDGETGGFVAGVDGCRAGWLVVLRGRRTGALSARVVPDFEAVLAQGPPPAVIGVDMPLGLLGAAVPGGRTCDLLARRLLGARAASVFSAPTRPALLAFRAGGGYRRVSQANKGGSPSAPGLSRQTYNLLEKIDKLDRLLPAAQCAVVEVHPELSFREAGGAPMRSAKRTAAGRAEREGLLARLGYGELLSSPRRDDLRGSARDDLLDACIVSWTAERVAAGRALKIPPAPPTDERGLPMAIFR
ncbi:MAG TPA: DUF429 domain-containing protein [Anaeromyxobacter sp.]|nr:DUF429 domain-containing protein [Anaeromyxobacter sp.]